MGPLWNECHVSPHFLQLEINDVTRAWGLEVDRVELAVEAVLQPPQDSPAGPSEEQGSLAGASPPGPSAVPLELRDSDPGQGPELWALSECLLLSSLPWLDLCSHPVAGWKQWSPV